MSLQPYQYVVLRCVPRADREEFLNVGIVVYCQALDYLACASDVSTKRLEALAPTLPVDAVCDQLSSIDAVCRGAESAGAAGTQPLGVRFGFLSAPRSTVVRPGPVHGGVTADPARALEHLLDRLVR